MPWTFLSNYGHVILAVARNPNARVREIADLVGITERAAQAILGELVEAGYLTRIREGRRNRYLLHADAKLRHPLEQDHEVGKLIDALGVDHAG